MPPLPPLSPDNTPRGYINYTSGTLSHTMQLRFPSGTSFGTIESALTEIADKMLPLMDPDDSVTTFEASNEGSNIRFIIGTYGGVGTAVGGVDNDVNRSCALSMTGKSEGGRIVAVSFFTILAGAYVDTRLPIGVVAANVADWFSSVADNSVEQPVAIDGETVNWNGYLNVRRDAYWQRAQR